MGRLILLGLLFAVTVQLSGAIDLITEDGHSLKFAWINYDKTRSSFPQCCGGNSDCSMVRISSEVDEIVRDKHEIYGLVNTWIHGRGNNIRMILSYSLETNRLSGTVYDRRGIYSIVSPTEAEKEIQPCFEPKVGDMSLYYKLIKTSNNPGQVFPVPLIQFIDISPPSGCCPPGKDCKVVDLELQSITSQSNPPLYLPTSYDPSTSAKTIYTLNRKSPRGCSSNCRTILYKNNRGSTLTARKRSGGKYSISLQESGGNFYELLECGQESLWVTNQIQKHFGSFDEETTSASTGTTTEATTGSPVNGTWKEWGAWTECSNDAQPTKKRTRECVGSQNGGTCPGEDEETKTCVAEYGWNNWEEWEECLEQGDSTWKRKRTRTCNTAVVLSWRNQATCNAGDTDTEFEVCPPVNGTYTEWSDWSACSNDAQPTKTKTRVCEGSLYGGTCDGAAEETKACVAEYGWNNWEEWGDCLEQDDSTWKRQRTRTCNTDVVLQWRNQATCNAGDTDTEVEVCPPVNGTFTEWGDWTACNNEAQPRKKRTRVCEGSLYGGMCPGAAEEEVECVKIYGWKTWGDWSVCQAQGGSTPWKRERTRDCEFKHWRSQPTCNEGATDTQSEVCAAVNGRWGSWSAWSSNCVKPGVAQTRSRECNNPTPMYGGNECPGMAQDVKYDGCTWGSWSCWEGKANRQTSECHDPNCVIHDVEQDCGHWSDWSGWSTCSCTNNVQEKRTRSCINEDSIYGKDCNGIRERLRDCNCNWSPWSSWSSCFDDYIHRTKTRHCTTNENQAHACRTYEEDSLEDENCSGYAWDCTKAGTEKSQNYDSGEYPANHNKKIPINSGSSKPLNIKFLAFEMEDGANCEFDWVKIYDANDNSKVWMDKTCGMDGAGREILTTSSSVIVETFTDGKIQKKGWSLEWCIPNLATVSSPNYPSEYDNNAASSQRIDVAPGKQIKLTFLDLNIEYHEHCAYDYVELTEKNGNAVGDGKYCGYKNPDQTLTVTSTSNSVYVHFHSDDIVKRKGFQLQWEEI